MAFPASKETFYTLGNVIPGALAEYLVLTEQALALAPAYLTKDEVAALPCAALTAWGTPSVEKGGLTPDPDRPPSGHRRNFPLRPPDRFCPRSHYHRHLLQRRKARSRQSPHKSAGTTHTINYKTHPDWENEALALTNKQGVDQILEVGGGSNVARSIKAIRPQGQISIIGLIDGCDATIPLFSLIQKNGILRGIGVPGLKCASG